MDQMMRGLDGSVETWRELERVTAASCTPVTNSTIKKHTRVRHKNLFQLLSHIYFSKAINSSTAPYPSLSAEKPGWHWSSQR